MHIVVFRREILNFYSEKGNYAGGYRYSVTVVPANEIPSDQYALGFAGNYQILVFSGQRSLGLKLKETSKLGPRPEKPIEIYEFERFGKLFQYWILKCCIILVQGMDRIFRPKVSQMGGKQQFPYMVDPNTGVSMYESDDIIKYLVDKYGDGNVPLLLSLGLLTVNFEGFAMIGRMGKGSSYSPSKLPPKPLEASPFCKVVREVLVELELPHILHSCARGSPKRQILYQRVGHFQSLTNLSSSHTPEPQAPDRWASLNPNFSLCANGKSQSPINIVTNQVVLNKNLQPLIRQYHAVNVTLVNNKFTVAIEYPDHTGGITVDEKQYVLKQMHWHSPSEHRIDGNRYAAELHMVHVADDGKVLVVATLFKYGHTDPVLAKIENKLNELGLRLSRQGGRSDRGRAIPPDRIEANSEQVRSISREQVEALKAPLDMRCKNNARPCQPINERHVEVYKGN
ncbi:UNVERIFIED_CONTAM: Alpha carbonic anhydrase 1, chloroplastic [Sesamum calycinum]|uniref:carbonic anhydrase n=1 Tax=Sesamum calycinum TaxID=2727403 RepID=A0AAW2NT60_9LAMI